MSFERLEKLGMLTPEGDCRLREILEEAKAKRRSIGEDFDATDWVVVR